MSYLHCPTCDRTAWLDASTEPTPICRHCESRLAPMPAARARRLTVALRKRFERDARLDVGRPRFVRH
jgi:hypothetical protein